MSQQHRTTSKTPSATRRAILEGLAIALPYSAVTATLPGAALAATSTSTSDTSSGSAQATNASRPLTELTAAEAVRKIQKGEIKAENYVTQLLAQYSAHKDLNAVSWIDEERALKSARDVDEAIAKGQKVGSLAGLPLVVKDNIDTVGFPTSAGTSTLKQNDPKKNAPVVETLLSQGAILLAKTNMHELAAGGTSSNPVFGPVKNPYDTERVPGGSSGGTGAAIAARIAPAGLGTDTSGSVRIPASFCGIASLRPTSTDPKPYSVEGVVPLALYFDIIGPMARTVEDVALLHSVITKSAMPQPKTLSGVRIGVPRTPFWEDLHPEVANVSERALERLRDAGVTLVELDFSDLGAETTKLQRGLVVATAKDDLEEYLAGRSVTVSADDAIDSIKSADVKGIYGASAASKTTAEEVQAMKETQRPKLRKLFESALQEHELSAVLFPTEPIPAPLINPKGDTLADEITLNGRPVNAGLTITRNTRFAPALGVPAVCLPAGLTADKLPVGLDLTGAAGSDIELLALALGIEQLLGRLPGPSGY